MNLHYHFKLLCIKLEALVKSLQALECFYARRNPFFLLQSRHRDQLKTHSSQILQSQSRLQRYTNLTQSCNLATKHLAFRHTPINDNHNYLKDKILDSDIYKIRSNNQRYTPNFKNCDREVCDLHGSHVTGIAIGSYGTYFGVAHNANAYSIGAIQSPGASAPTPMRISSYFWYKDDVKILNNSWGSNTFPFINTEIVDDSLSKTTTGKSDNSPTSVVSYISTYWKGYDKNGLKCENCDTTNEAQLMQLSRDKNVMIVFAAGNEGMVSPNIQSMLPRYDESLRSWITVGAFNPAYVTKSQDGSLNFESNKALSDFSNGFYGAESWGILAPGEDIYSAAIGKMDSQYDKKSGTSMAAPFVSGAAALVQEKFPDLNGRQIADVLLSTANKNVVLPKMILKTFTDKNIRLLLVVKMIRQAPTMT